MGKKQEIPVASSRLAVAHMDADLVLAGTDPLLEDLLGLGSGDLEGRGLLEFVPPSHGDDLRAGLARALGDGDPVSRLRFPIVTQAGSIRWLEAVAVTTRRGRKRHLTLVCLPDASTLPDHAETERSGMASWNEEAICAIRSLAHMSNLRDPYTGLHESRVGALSAAIGRALGLDRRTCETLRLAGDVHDIGKVAVPIEILTTARHLTEPELEIIRSHPQHGHAILEHLDLPDPVAMVAHQHHERLDGSGYPDHLTGAGIRLESRILAVADVVEAMSSHRPYRPSLGLRAALAEVEQGKGKTLDAEVVEVCLGFFSRTGFDWPADLY